MRSIGRKIDQHHCNVDRRAALTEREKQIEGIGLADDDSEDTVVQSSSGSIIPIVTEESAFCQYATRSRWHPDSTLAIQVAKGLHRSYDCEVCGNISYKEPCYYNKALWWCEARTKLHFLGSMMTQFHFSEHQYYRQKRYLCGGENSEQIEQRKVSEENAVEVEDEGQVM